MSVLGEITPEEFLKSFWQKQPCLIRQAVPGFVCPLSPEELAGLACEDNSQARLVIEEPDRANGWKVEYGPFTDAIFKQLPATHWSLLVSHVEQFLPPVNDLLSRFSFIPNWRIDDVMISYAPDQGSVGPHLDSYDVFLLQGMGQRHWQINRHDYTERDFIPDLELRILNDFRAEEEWTLSPGDMLYLPPGVAHHGVARGPAMTLSIGFLAPLCSDLANHYIDNAFRAAGKDHRFSDPDRLPQNHAGEITASDLERIRRMMQSTLADDTAINDWFGRYITESAFEPEATQSIATTDAFLARITAAGCLRRHGGIRAVYIRSGNAVNLYMHGRNWQFSIEQLDLVQVITGNTSFYPDDFHHPQHGRELGQFLLQLYNLGFYYLSDE